MMWSNESVTTAAAADKNMASQKSKMSHRKRKGKNTNQTTTSTPDTPAGNNRKSKNNSKKSTKSKPNNGDINKNIGPDLLESIPPPTVADETDHAQPVRSLINNANNTSVKADLAVDDDDDVVLRHSVATDVDETAKIRTDNYITDNQSDSVDDTFPNLSQTTTRGSLDLDESHLRTEDIIRKQPRRLSDLFRYGSTNHNSNSMNNISKGSSQVKTVSQFDIGEKGQVTLKKVQDSEVDLTSSGDSTNSKDKQKAKDKSKVKKASKEKEKDKKTTSISLKRSDSTASTRTVTTTESKKSVFKQPETPKAKIKIKEEKEATNSMLKRVKSKIYSSKHKNEPVIPPMPEINENCAFTKSSKDEQRKSTHFEFRLIRQSSNLESIRPRTILGNFKQNSLDIPDNAMESNGLSAKPVFAKSKSSSAINLSLLRSRRNKGLDGKNKNCQEAVNEFDFISFGGVNSTNLNKSVQVTRKFGSQNFMSGDFDGNSNNRNIFSSMRNLVEKCGETKPVNPVSRSGSDRRPDPLREESQQQQQQQNQQQSQSQLPSDQQIQHQHQRVNSSDHAHSNDADLAAHPDSSTSLPPSSGNRDRSGKINRTASLKEKQPDKKTQTKKPRNISDPLTSRHDSDQAEFTLSQSGSSSGSSSNSLSPSSSIDAGGGLHDIQHGIANDSDLDVGYELPDWSANIPPDILAALTAEEKKRQELINEFFHTEQYHLRKLKILDKIFYGPLTHKKVFSECDMNLIFANLPELVEIHSCFNSTMKAKRKDNPLVGEVVDLIFNMFDSPKGDELQRAAASFCERQHLALELITERRKKDQRVETALASCEKSHHCERQNLQSFMSAEMHRITRYPILIERLIETTKKVHSERSDGDAESQAEVLERLRLALTRCKEIVNNVNETVRTASNRSKLQEIQDHLEILIEKQIESSGLRHEHNLFVSEYKNLDLTKYTLIREDKVELLRTNRNPINLQMLLLEEAVVFLIPENEKYTLKFIQSGIPATPFLAPIIKVPSFIVRLNAARNTTIFLLNLRAENMQMYELRAKSKNDRDAWFKQLSDAAEAYNRRESGRLRPRTEPAITSTPLAAAINTPSITTSISTPITGGTPTTSIDGNDDTISVQSRSSSSPTTHRNGVTPDRSDATVAISQGDASGIPSSPTDDVLKRRNNAISLGTNRYRDSDDLDDKRLSQPDMEGVTSHTSAVGGGVMVKLEADDWSLVQPSEVQVAVPPVHTAQPVLTPLEKIKRKDEEVRQALADKRVLVADLLSIPLQDYQDIADMVSSESQQKPTDSEPTELVLAAVHQVDMLLNLMNEALNVTEADAVLASGGKHPSCSVNAPTVQQQQNSANHVPSVPIHRLQSIVPLLSTQLTNLLSLTKQGEEEKLTLRKELQRTRELLQVNAVSEEQDLDHHQEPFQSGDLERIDESPTETETT